MQMFTEALMDFTAAKKIDEKNQSFDAEIEKLRKAIQTGEDSWKDEWETDLLWPFYDVYFLNTIILYTSI